MGIEFLLESFSREELLHLIFRVLEKSPKEWTKQLESATLELMQAAGRTLELLSFAESGQFSFLIQQCKTQTMTSLAEGPAFCQVCEIIEFWMKGLKQRTPQIATAWKEVEPQLVACLESILESQASGSLEHIAQGLARLSSYHSDLPESLKTVLGAFLPVAFELEPTKESFVWVLKSGFCSPATIRLCLTRLTSLWEGGAMKADTYTACFELCNRHPDLQWEVLSSLAKEKPLLPTGLPRLLERFCRSHTAELTDLLALQWPATTKMMTSFLQHLWTVHYEYVRVPADWSPAARKKFQQDLDLRRKNRSYGEFGEIKLPPGEDLELVGALEAWLAWRHLYRQLGAVSKPRKEFAQLEEAVLGELFGPQHIWAKVAAGMAPETADLSQSAAKIFQEIQRQWTNSPYWLKFPKPSARDLSPKRSIKAEARSRSLTKNL